jgi:hypothetical protein
MSKYPPVKCPYCGAESCVLWWNPGKGLCGFQCLPEDPSAPIHKFTKPYPPKKEEGDNGSVENGSLELL